MKTITVIFPCYRVKRETIINGILYLRQFLKEYSLYPNFIVSQNGGGDKLSFQFTDTFVVNTPNKGFGVAMKKAAPYIKGNYWYVSSPDLPFHGTDLRQMMRLKNTEDLIFGSKLHPDSVYHIHLFRYLSTLTQQKIIQIVFKGFPIADPNGTIFAHVSKTIHVLKEIESNDFFFNTEFAIRSWQLKLKMNEVPVTYNKQDSISSVKLQDDTLSYFKQLLALKAKYGNVTR